MSQILRAIVGRFRHQPPVVPPPPSDLEAALELPPGDYWTPTGLLLVRDRLSAAAAREWATRALAEFDKAPSRFVYLALLAIAEHGQTAAAVLTAALELQRRTPGARTLDRALAQLGLSESAWLAAAGLAFPYQPGPAEPCPPHKESRS